MAIHEQLAPGQPPRNAPLQRSDCVSSEALTELAKRNSPPGQGLAPRSTEIIRRLEQKVQSLKGRKRVYADTPYLTYEFWSIHGCRSLSHTPLNHSLNHFPESLCIPGHSPESCSYCISGQKPSRTETFISTLMTQRVRVPL